MRRQALREFCQSGMPDAKNNGRGWSAAGRDGEDLRPDKFFAGKYRPGAAPRRRVRWQMFVPGETFCRRALPEVKRRKKPRRQSREQHRSAVQRGFFIVAAKNCAERKHGGSHARSLSADRACHPPKPMTAIAATPSAIPMICAFLSLSPKNTRPDSAPSSAAAPLLTEKKTAPGIRFASARFRRI